MLQLYIKKVLKYIILKRKLKGILNFSYNCFITRTSTFEGSNAIYPNSSFSGYLGRGSYIQSNCAISGKIGRYTSIGPEVKVIYGKHPYKEPFVTTSPMFFSTKKQGGNTYATQDVFEELTDADPGYPVVIGNDCWIGFGARLVAGIHIGDGAMVLAGALVTSDVPPYTIWGGYQRDI
jgi:acetyltransferase-like isoleucine patch superfamily enzyme